LFEHANLSAAEFRARFHSFRQVPEYPAGSLAVPVIPLPISLDTVKKNPDYANLIVCSCRRCRGQRCNRCAILPQKRDNLRTTVPYAWNWPFGRITQFWCPKLSEFPLARVSCDGTL